MKKSFLSSATAVFLLALILRLIFAAGGLANPRETRFSRPDTESYTAPAISLVHLGEYRDAEGKITAHRTPGLPVLLGCLSPFGGETLFSVILLFLGSLTVFPIYATCRKLLPPDSDGIAALATLLFAVNLTSIAHAPMLLSDTFFTLAVAISLYFFISFLTDEKHVAFELACAALFAGLATLIRPVNVLWFIPAAIVLLFIPKVAWARRILWCLLLSAVFVAVLLPWILRNNAIGAGMRIDASSAVTMVHNAAALESVVTGVPEDQIRERYQDEMMREFARNPLQYAPADARFTYCERKMAGVILQHPFRYLWLSIRPYTLLPDVPTLLENTGVTVGGRGTFDVLNRQGLFAAVKHYFAEAGTGGTIAVILTVPLLVFALLLYMLAFLGLCLVVRQHNWCLALCFLLFGVYYLVMPGPVTMPRYQLPALPVLCVFAALAIQFLTLAIRQRRIPEKP